MMTAMNGVPPVSLMGWMGRSEGYIYSQGSDIRAVHYSAMRFFRCVRQLDKRTGLVTVVRMFEKR